jgi:hypothetical protein
MRIVHSTLISALNILKVQPVTGPLKLTVQTRITPVQCAGQINSVFCVGIVQIVLKNVLMASCVSVRRVVPVMRTILSPVGFVPTISAWSQSVVLMRIAM